MKRDYEIVLRDVYGGDGFTRYMETEQSKLKRTKTSTRTRRDIGIPVEDSVDEITKETSLKEVATFSYNGTEKPMLRLGGSHGKLWGAMRSVAQGNYSLGLEGFTKSYIPVLNQISVWPDWVELEPLEPMEVRQIFQKLSGGRSAIALYYDVIPKAKCVLTISYPDSILKLAEQLIGGLMNISLFNKRRARIESMQETNHTISSDTLL